MPFANVTIAPSKLLHYLLTPREENDKASFLASAGYDLGHARALDAALREIATGEAMFLEKTEYGDKFEIRGTLRMTETATHETKFITLYPDKK